MGFINPFRAWPPVFLVSRFLKSIAPLQAVTACHAQEFLRHPVDGSHRMAAVIVADAP